MFCPQCGADNSDSAAFCHECGVKLAECEGGEKTVAGAASGPDSQPEPGPQPEPGSQPLKPKRHRRLRAVAIGAGVVVALLVVVMVASGSGSTGGSRKQGTTGSATTRGNAEVKKTEEAVITLSEVENEKLRAYFSANVDTDGSGIISAEEAEKVAGLEIAGLDIDDYGFLAKFPNVTSINCQSNPAAALDVSACKNLTTLNCAGGQLTSLNIAGCAALEALDCSGNPLTSMDFTGCAKLARVVMGSGIDFGSAGSVDDASREGLSALALEYVYFADGTGGGNAVGAVGSVGVGNADLNVRLVQAALSPGELGLGWYDANGEYKGELEAANGALDVSQHSISSADLQRVLRSFYGSDVDLDAMASSSSSLLNRSGDTWTWSGLAAPVGTGIYTNNFRASGNMIRYDIGVRQQDNNLNDDTNGSYYTVTAVLDPSSIFGYHLVRIDEMSGDAASEFPWLAAAQVQSAQAFDFTGSWHIVEWNLTVVIQADGVAGTITSDGSTSTGTWERDENDPDMINLAIYEDDGDAISINMMGEEFDDQVRVYGRATSVESMGQSLSLGAATAKKINE